MKRRTPLKRTELSRTTRLIRARRPDPEDRGRLAAAKRRETGPTTAVRALVWARDGGCCVVCGLRGGPHVFPPHQVHHRRPRAAGGSRRADTNGPANLIVLCAFHHGHVEGRREQAIEAGLLVHQAQDPAATPLYYRGRWVLLTDSGDIEELP